MGRPKFVGSRFLRGPAAGVPYLVKDSKGALDCFEAREHFVTEEALHVACGDNTVWRALDLWWSQMVGHFGGEQVQWHVASCHRVLVSDVSESWSRGKYA